MILDDLLVNMGISLETYILLIIILGSLIFMAVDFRLGIIMMFILSSSFLLILQTFNRNITYYIYTIIISFILLTLSLIISNKKSGGGY